MKLKSILTVIALWVITLQSCELKTEPLTPPTMAPVVVSGITTAAAVLSCNISHSGNQDILEHGFVYSETNTAPTVDDSKTVNGAINPTTPTPIDFSDRIEGLKINTSYNVRPYATIASGPVYGEVTTFKTLNIIQPGIRTDAATAISVNSARIGGTLLSAGTFPVSEYGVCWSSTNANPTTGDSKAFNSGNIASFPNTYILSATDLTQNTTYNFRAYVISNGVTSYGATLTFKTPLIVQPEITTDGSSSVSVNFAKLSGTLKAAGSFPISEHGICWSTNPNPTTGNSKSQVFGNVSSFPHTFVQDAGGLTPSTTYNFRAYVISNGVTTYGANLTFRTSDVVYPGISTGGSSSVSVNYARLDGTITSGGSYPVSEYGICWSINANPTTGDTKSQRFGNPGGFPSSFSVDATGLSPSTAYNYRAYVVSNGVTIYGNNMSFRTSVVVNASVTTVGGVYLGSGQGMRFSGRIDNGGSYGVSEYGICYSTATSTPTTANSKLSSNSNPGSYPFNYSMDLSRVTGGIFYYYRAYVISNGVTSYGNVMQLSTGKD